MNKRTKGRKFGRKSDQRRMFFRSLLRALILEEKIKTTEARAKEIRPKVEKLITKGKMNTIHTRRQLLATFGNDYTIVKKIVDDLSPRFKERAGGYTRITKIISTRSDGAKEAVIEFV